MAFVVGVAGSAVLLDYSTLNSSIQPLIRDSMRRLIMSSVRPDSYNVLKMIQENVSRKEFSSLFSLFVVAPSDRTNDGGD